MALGEWLSLVNIITAIIVGILTAAVTWYVSRAKELQRLTISQYTPSIVFQSEENAEHRLAITLDGIPYEQLNRQRISVQNTGNKTVMGIDIMIHAQWMPDVLIPLVTKNFSGDYKAKIYDPELQSNRFALYSIDYLNPGDIFDVEVLFSGDLADLEVEARMPNVEIKKIRKSESAAIEAFAIDLVSTKNLVGMIAKSVRFAAERVIR